MSIHELTADDAIILVCDECPSIPDYSIDDTDWEKSCQHIEAYITGFQDIDDPGGMLSPGAKYLIPMSLEAQYSCRDPWALWVKFYVGDRKSNGTMDVAMQYDPQLYTQTTGMLGFITIDDTRQTLRLMMWDALTVMLLERYPDADQPGKLKCPQKTHKAVKEFAADCSEAAGIQAQVACIVLENCCTHCYRETAGQDADDGNFGMQNAVNNTPAFRKGNKVNFSPKASPASPAPGAQSQAVPSRSRTQTKMPAASSPVNSSISTTSQSGLSTKSLTLSPLVQAQVESPSPINRRTMAEQLNDPEMPF